MEKKNGAYLERKVQPNKQGKCSSYLALGISYATAGASTDVCMDNHDDSITNRDNTSNKPHQMENDCHAVDKSNCPNIKESDDHLPDAIKQQNKRCNYVKDLQLEGENLAKERSTEEMEMETEGNCITYQSIFKNDKSIPSITLVKDMYLDDLKNNSYHHLYSNAALDIDARSNHSPLKKPAQMSTKDRNIFEVKHSPGVSIKATPAKSNFDLPNEAKNPHEQNMSVADLKENDSSKAYIIRPTFN